MTSERVGEVTLEGKPVTLIGPPLKVGDKAPDFILTDTNLQYLRLADFKGKILILVSVPSLDTPVCDLEARRFNSEAMKLGEDVVVLIISMDLPFAQKRWCGIAGIDRVITASDYREASFGLAYGILIKELRLLARAIFVVDRKGVIRYIQIVPEIGKEPDYNAVLDAVKKIIEREE